MMQQSINFSHTLPDNSVLDELPVLHEPIASLDTETSGLDIWRSPAMPVGLCIADSTREFYLPFGHSGGKQYEPNKVRLWAREQLRGKTLRVHQKFDIHMAKKWGLDLEELNCKLFDVTVPAALLDDHRRRFDLDTLARERLGRGKLEFPSGGALHDLPAGAVAPYARNDARLTYDLASSYDHDITREGLQELVDLENDLIYCICAMERNGAYLDMPKLIRWDVEIERAYTQRIMELHRRTGLRINPDSPGPLTALFKYLNLPFTFTEEGKESFAEEILEKFAKQSYDIQLALEARQLKSMRSKYTSKYLREVEPGGLLRYQLHQLRTDDSGTITGRFSSSKVNIQQVKKPSKQKPVTKPWIIRELFIPPPGRTWLRADASQIEYRLFAHYSCVPWPHSNRLIDAYNSDANLDFHQMVTDDILGGIMIRDLAKNWNFRKLYGGGASKAAEMTGLPLEECERQDADYDQLFPEARRLLDFCTNLAQRRGYVKTYMNRKATFSRGDRFYSALNRILQGTAAEIMKKKLLESYNNRKLFDMVMRFTVHDEKNSDVDSPTRAKPFQEFLNQQTTKLRVPITWDVKTGNNWSMK